MNLDSLDAGDAPSQQTDLVKLFSESNSRFVVEVAKPNADTFKQLFAADEVTEIGEVTSSDRLAIRSGEKILIDEDIDELKACWQKPLAW